MAIPFDLIDRGGGETRGKWRDPSATGLVAVVPSLPNPVLPAQLRFYSSAEPTGLNANHLALVSDGCLSLGEQL
jgi:hypothetical protein